MMTKPALLFAAVQPVSLRASETGDGEVLAPYYPTPETIVQKMLQLGGLKAGEKMFDLGSGDGRIVIMAADKFHANAVGVELDKDLFKQSMDRIQKLKLQKTARIINGDILTQDFSSADLIYRLPPPAFERQNASHPRQTAKEGRPYRRARFRIQGLEARESRDHRRRWRRPQPYSVSLTGSS
jgi:hypothetical protein